MKRYVAVKPFNSKVFYKNGLFDKKYEIGSPYFITIKKLLKKKNIEINTIDISVKHEIEKYVYMDVPYPWEYKLWMDLIRHTNKNILYVLEPPIVNPFNFMKIIHMFFNKVYIWDSRYVDKKRYFQFYMSKTREGLNTRKIAFNKKKFLILMNRNLVPFLPFKPLALSTKEYYTERMEAIGFFDKNYSDDFSLYGRGWNRPSKLSLRQRVFGYKKYKTYKGEFLAKHKYNILSKFKFCLCFDNTNDPGNISEKIFDCFKAKTVPIYRGASDIKKHIPKSCYIDAEKFANYDELYKFLKKMNETRYNSYINNAQKLLKDKQFQETWFDEGFARFFVKSLDLD